MIAQHKDRFATYDDARKAWKTENCGFYDNAYVFGLWLFSPVTKSAFDIAKEHGLCC